MKLIFASLIVVATPAFAGDPKPAAELAELAGGLAGTWKCTGKAAMDGTTMADTKVTMSNRSDLDAWWIQTNFTAVIGHATYKFTGFTGYNAAEKRFYRYMVDNSGAAEIDTALSIDHGMADKWAIHWDGRVRGNTAMPSLHTETDPARQQAIDQARAAGILAERQIWTSATESYSKDGLQLTGKMSIDDGKTWTPAYDVLCKH